MPGPPPGRPTLVTAPPLAIISRIVAFMMEEYSFTSPAAAVPVRIKMPEPITAPTPNAINCQGPSVLASRFWGSSLVAMSASMLLVRKSWLSGMRPVVY